MIKFGVLGPMTVVGERGTIAVPAQMQRRLLALFLASRGGPISLERAADELWEGKPPRTARKTLLVYIHRLRRLLRSDDSFQHQPAGYVLCLAPDAVDSCEFESLATQSVAARKGGDLARASVLAVQAMALWRGSAYADIKDVAAVAAHAKRLDECRLDIIEQWADLELTLGRHTELIGNLAAPCAENPYRERLQWLLMLALYRNGRQAEALAHYRRTRVLLGEELGIEPTPQLELLHKQILNNDPALSAPLPVGRVTLTGRQFLPRDIPDFTGRTADLDWLDGVASASVEAAGAVIISAIAGVGGVGKTALAVHWANRAASRFPDGQLYLNLRGYDPRHPLDPAEAISALLRALDVPYARIPDDIEEASSLFRAMVADQRLLILLDNARSVDQVRPLLPASPGSLVVITSRDSLTGLIARDGACRLTLDTLLPTEAVDLLARILGTDRVAEDPQAVADLASACGYLPLALRISAANLTGQPTRGVAAYAEEIASGKQLNSLSLNGDTLSDLRVVFSWSYRGLSNASARLFRLLALHPGPDVGVAAVASLLGEQEEPVRALLAELASAHLLVELTSGRYSFHDLLRVYAIELAETVDGASDRYVLRQRVLDHYLHTAYVGALLLEPHRSTIALSAAQPGVRPEDLVDLEDALEWFGAEQHVVMAVIEQAADSGFDTHTWQLTWAVGYYFYRQGNWRDWVTAQRTALGAAQRLGDLGAVTNAHRSLARALIQLGQHQEAHLHLKNASGLCEERGDRAGLAITHQHLADLCYHQRLRQAAVVQTELALDIYREIGDMAGEAAALNNLGWYHGALDNYHDALICCEKALSVQREIGDRNGEAATWDSLGNAHQHLGDFQQAARCYRHCLELYRELGRRHAETKTLTRLGETYYGAGDLKLAHDAWQHALNILDELGHLDAETLRARIKSCFGGQC